MRTYLWVRTDGSEEVTLMRDRLAAVLRSSLLDYPCLKAYDERTSFRAQIDESTLSEEFSDLTLLKGDRMMAGAYLGYTLEIDEVLQRKPIGTVEEIQVSLYQVGVNETMPILSASVSGESASTAVL
jgi:hypothetical protein